MPVTVSPLERFSQIRNPEPDLSYDFGNVTGAGICAERTALVSAVVSRFA